MEEHIERDVTAVVTAMTEGERPYFAECIQGVACQQAIGQIIVCVQTANRWAEQVLTTVQFRSPCELLKLPLLPQGAVRNRAVERSSLPWVAFCDGDDVWCAGKIALQRRTAELTCADFIGCDHYLTDESGVVRAVALAMYLPMPSSWMVRTAVMRTHPFSESPSLLGIEDDEWWKRTRDTVAKVRLPRLLLRYRVRPGTTSSGDPSKRRKERWVALGQRPVLGKLVLAGTFCAWWINRRDYYLPLKR